MRPAGLGRVVVRGRSMQPTLHDGDHLLVRYGATPRVGRLAVVHLAEDLLSVKRLTLRDPSGWWVERDNPLEGTDSWHDGAVADPDVLAVVLCRYWPLRLRRRRPRRLRDQ